MMVSIVTNVYRYELSGSCVMSVTAHALRILYT